MNLIMYFLLIGFVWSLTIQLGLKLLNDEEETWSSFTIGVNVLIWPYTMVTFAIAFIKAFIKV